MSKVLCPRCRRSYYTPYGESPPSDYWEAPYPALSRMDNKTYVCSECGQKEAMRDFAGAGPIPPSEWPVKGDD